jgi:hypothetical protein
MPVVQGFFQTSSGKHKGDAPNEMKMWRMQGGTKADGSYAYDAMFEHLIRLIPGKYEKIMAEK